MAPDRAVFWLAVVGLRGVGILVGQVLAVVLAAIAAVVMAYQNDRLSQS